MKTGFFLICLLVITTISSIDAYLNIRYGIISSYEENPLAKAILKHSRDDLGLLMSLKMMGTSAVVAILTAGLFLKPNHTLIIAGAVAAFQVTILYYMLTA